MANQGNKIPPDYATRIVKHKDGYYWIDIETSVQFGPFPNVSQAITDLESSADIDIDADDEPGRTLHDAEDELGFSDWVDPDSGEPAEDHVPHIRD